MFLAKSCADIPMKPQMFLPLFGPSHNMLELHQDQDVVLPKSPCGCLVYKIWTGSNLSRLNHKFTRTQTSLERTVSEDLLLVHINKPPEFLIAINKSFLELKQKLGLKYKSLGIYPREIFQQAWDLLKGKTGLV